MRNYTLQSVFAPTKGLILLIILCFTVSFSNAQNLLSSNNPGFEGTGGFQSNGYTNISPGTSGSSSDGNYALTGNSGPMNTSSFNSVSPHSGAKMMVVDANNQIFWQQNPNIELKGGVKYTFSYWVVNINKNGTSNGAFPNPVIQFNAADNCGCTPILKSGSATVNNATWQQVVYEFTPSGTGAKWVRIELSTPGASPNGNDFAIDDLSLTEPPLPLSISTSKTGISCPGLTDGSISAYGFGGVQPYSYKLTPSVGLSQTNLTGIFTDLASGSYKVEVFDSSTPTGSAAKANIVINSVLDMTIAGSVPTNAALVPATNSQPLSTTICSGSTITLSANNMVGYAWSATPTDPTMTTPNSSSISVSPTVTTVYKVTATGPTGALSNLVYNGDFENDVAGFSSDYKYLALNPAYEKRSYGVIDNPRTWGTVYDIASDHTNPGTGKFFITDGSTSTVIIDKVWGQNIAVKPGVTYDFNYFLRTITSTSPSLPARMQLKINGVVLNNTASSAIDVAPATTAGGWVSYKHTWTAGIGVTVAKIELYDIETSGPGNDFGLDDITFIAQGLPTCVVSKEITVNISPGTSETKFTYPAAAVCQSVTTFTPTKTNPTAFTAGGTWSKSSTGGTLSINSSTGEINPSLSTVGTFTVKYEVLANPSICQAAGSSAFSVTINPVPSILTTPGGSLCGPGVVSMSATASAGATINWYTATTGAAFTSGNTVNTPASISASINYYVDATLNGCTSAPRETVTATIKPIPTISTTPGGSSCGPGVVNMSATATAGATINWYTATTGASFGTGNSINTPSSISATTTYYVDATLNGCTSASRTPIKAVVNPPLTFICGTQTNSSVTFKWSAVPGATSYDYTYTKSSGGSAIPGNITATSLLEMSLSIPGLLPGESVSISVKPLGSSCSIFVGPFSCTASLCNTPTTDVITNIEQCANTSVSVPVFSSPLGSTATFKWKNDNVAIGLAAASGNGNLPAFTLANVMTTQKAKITVNAYDPATSCTGPDMIFYITANPLPTVTVNSPSVCAGSTATVTATPGIAGTYDYTWTVPATATNPGNVANFSTAVAGNYSVVITNTTTTCPSASASGVVTINPLPTVTVNTAPVCFGNSATVTAVPVPAGTYNYTWTVPTNASPPGNVASFSTAVAGNYSVVIADANCSSTSGGNTVVINPLPSFTVNSPTVCAGTAATLAATTVDTGTFSYVWTIPSTATAPGDVDSFPTTVAGDYSVVATNTVTNCSSSSAGGKVTVTPLPTLALASAVTTNDQTTCINTAITPISYTVGGSATDASATGLPAGVNGVFVSGVFTITGTPTESGTFNYSVETTGGCLPSVILAGTIVVNPLPTMVLSSPAATIAQTICLNDAITSISYTVGGSATGATVVTGTRLPAGVTGVFVSGVFTISGTPTESGTFNYTVQTSGGCTPPVSFNGTITINELPIVDYTGLTDICSGEMPPVVLNSTIPGTTFSWNAVSNNASGASPVIGSVIDKINQTLTATGIGLGQVVFNVTPKIGACIGQAKAITINVSPVPDVIPTALKNTLCSGESTSIDLSSSKVGTTFTWTATASGVTGSALGNGIKIAQTLSNNDIVPGTVDYVITPSVNGCVGISVPVTITVNPLPEVFGTPPAPICSGDSTRIELDPSIVGTVFDWTVEPNGVTGATDGTGELIDQVLETSSASQGFVVYKITPTLSGCKGGTFSIPVTVNPSPKPTLQDGVICVEQATGVAYKTFELDAGLRESDYNFKWYLNTLPISGALGTFEVEKSGDYTVQATDKSTGCFATSEIAKVTASFPGLAVTTTQTSAFSDNAKVEVKVSGGTAVFEYQLDGGFSQSSNVFQYLSPGAHTITVGDENGCTTLTENFFVIGYPKFFTPNGDDRNMAWNVLGLEGQPKAIIYIFDRYGKLIKQISPSGEGWDGSYSGQPLPATDYWFTVEFSEESAMRIFKAHFSLLR